MLVQSTSQFTYRCTDEAFQRVLERTDTYIEINGVQTNRKQKIIRSKHTKSSLQNTADTPATITETG